MLGLRGPLGVVEVPRGGGSTRALGRCVRGRVEQQGGPPESRATGVVLRIQNRRKGQQSSYGTGSKRHKAWDNADLLALNLSSTQNVLH